MKKKKWLILTIGAAAVAVAGLLVYIFLPDKNSQAAEVPVNTATVTKGNIVVSVSGAGSVIATETGKVKTKDSGKVAEVLVEAGDIVKKGQTLITFEGEDLSDSLKQEKSSLDTLLLDLEDKQEQYKKLAQAGSSEDELSSAKRSIEKAKTDIQNQNEKITSVQEDMIPPDPLTAPIDGTVTAVNIASGEQAMDGSELIDLTNYSKLSVVVQVDELDIPTVKEGMPATITLDALPDTEFAGTVTDIAEEGVASNGVSLFDVTVGLTASEGARVGMSSEVSITTAEKSDILTVPIEAVQERNGIYLVAVPASEGTAAVTGSAETGGAGGPMPSGGARPSGAPDAGGEGMAAGGTRGTRGGAMPGGAPGAGTAAADGEGTAAQGARGNWQSGRAMGNGTQQMVTVEVGIHDESSMEIVSGLAEGDKVILPTVISTGSSAATAEQQMQGGMGGFGGGFTGGGAIPGGTGGAGGFGGGTRGTGGGTGGTGGGGSR